MDFKVGDRVTSDEVTPNFATDSIGNVSKDSYQVKHLEIVKFVDEKTVLCKYFSETISNQKVDEHTVSIDALTFVNKKPLVMKSSAEDDFFNI